MFFLFFGLSGALMASGSFVTIFIVPTAPPECLGQPRTAGTGISHLSHNGLSIESELSPPWWSTTGEYWRPWLSGIEDRGRASCRPAGCAHPFQAWHCVLYALQGGRVGPHHHPGWLQALQSGHSHHQWRYRWSSSRHTPQISRQAGPCQKTKKTIDNLIKKKQNYIYNNFKRCLF